MVVGKYSRYHVFFLLMNIYFNFFTITNNYTVNVFVWMYLFISLEYIPKSTVVGFYEVIPCLTFWGTAKLFSKGTVPFCILISTVLGVLVALHACQHLVLALSIANLK